MCSVQTLSDEELFCLEGCSNYPQYYKMRRDFENKSCTFCNLDRTLNTVLFEDNLVLAWLVPEQFKRKELAYHALFVPKRHVRFEIDLTIGEVLSLHFAKKYLHTNHGYRGGNTHVREGDMTLNAGTVPHLHYNTFMPNCTGEVKIPVYKNPDDRVRNQTRAYEFAQRYVDGEVPA